MIDIFTPLLEFLALASFIGIVFGLILAMFRKTL